MYTAAKTIFVLFLFGFSIWVTKTDLRDIQRDDEIVYSEAEPNTHDAKCNCDYCTEPLETPYYMEIAGIDSSLKLGQNLTVIAIDTVYNTTCISLK